MITQILLAWFCVAILMALFWCLYRILNNPGVVDLAWVIAIVLAGLVYLSANTWNQRSVIIGSVLLLWGIRLGGYILITRIVKGHVDKRYIEMSQQWKLSSSLGFFLHYQFQGLLSLLISIIFLFTASAKASMLTTVDLIGLLLVITGILGEAIADRQLHRFQQRNTRQVCNIGLWKYSRHPNYFYEWLTWMGFALTGLSAQWGYLAFISPLTLYLIMNYLTIPITEKSSLRSRGTAYKDYQDRTSVFFLWFRS